MPARKAAEVATEIAARGQRLKGVRIDSGDLAGLAIKVRKILNEAGFPDIKIIGSGGLDEYNLTKLGRSRRRYVSAVPQRPQKVRTTFCDDV